ncbi:MAG TPA: hypothetical protein VN426_13645 [Syntrophomonadaceae bacterium]|nr:hypothetical protein [Syntrophomonadaceae bacterium]
MVAVAYQLCVHIEVDNMDLLKPYLRIVRDQIDGEFISDNRYSIDRQMLCRAYSIIENDLRKLFEYIEPCEDNINTYSHRTFELLMRAATEFEMNCKEILRANGFIKTGNLNITDYYLINVPSKLSNYKVKMNFWQSNALIIQPFNSWSGESYQPLEWYQAYNHAKHNRNMYFAEASIQNTIKAVTGLFIILFSQFGIDVFSPFQNSYMYNTDDDGGVFGDGSMMFTIIPPQWSRGEKYNFDWELLKSTAEPFNKYSFY